MNPDAPSDWLNQPPVPLEQLHQQSLKNRDYAVAVLAHLPTSEAEPLQEEFEQYLREIEAAYRAKDAVEHYRLDQHFFFHYLTKLNFAMQIAQPK